MIKGLGFNINEAVQGGTRYMKLNSGGAMLPLSDWNRCFNDRFRNCIMSLSMHE